MPERIVECIPNFSEARRLDVVAAIADAIQQVEGVKILDTHSDVDHNRTVITFVGNPEAVEAAAFNGIAKAAQLIDLDEHQGEHPRIGATDVVPFVPISGVTMLECIEIARRLGKRVGEALSIPVYLYEEAATRSERTNLEEIRRGQYELLKTIIATDSTREPDFGPKKMTGAGATVIGARQPLIAYNIYLDTEDVNIAQKISRQVRNSSGGFHFVKAMGVLVEGRAQVSMNLTNYKKSPIAQVTEMVRREAMRYGVGIHHSEVVGLTPTAALINAARWYLQLDQFDSSQLLESRLYEGEPATIAPTGTLAEASLLDAIASANPTPGGGSASAHSAATAAALVAMVGRLTVGKTKYADVSPEMLALIEQAEQHRKRLTAAVDEDAQAFEAFMAARKMPKESEVQKKQRDDAIRLATLHAALIPLSVASDALKVMQMALRMAEVGNLNAITDAGTAVNLAYASIKGAAMNVKINLLGIESESEPASILKDLEKVNETAETLITSLKGVLLTRSNLTL